MFRINWILKRVSLQHMFESHHLLNAKIRSFNDRRNKSATLLTAVSYFFPGKRSKIVVLKISNKKFIIKSKLKCKLIMMCFQGPLVCYDLVTLDTLLVTQTLYFSQFFPRFFVGLRRICLCANVLNFGYKLCGYENWMRAIFSWMKNTLFSS